jgi:4-hydroxybenzoate polyprenyltransferase
LVFVLFISPETWLIGIAALVLGAAYYLMKKSRV